jgi:hypothetical protein
MNDDYDDPDEPGGLWDPDAHRAPPDPQRATLRAVPPPDLIEDHPHNLEPGESSADTLVRLDQFRPIAHEPAPDERAPSRGQRMAVAVAAMVVTGAILAAGVPRFINEGKRMGTTPATTPLAGINAERAALTRALRIAANAHGPAGNRQSSARVSTQARASAKRSDRQRQAHATRNASPSHTSKGAISTRPVTVATARASTTPARSSPTRPAARASAAPPSTANAEFGFEG